MARNCTPLAVLPDERCFTAIALFCEAVLTIVYGNPCLCLALFAERVLPRRMFEPGVLMLGSMIVFRSF
ncbi:hypothetical protein DL546_002542 [Coniochaeta pulveracea]|uniref:Uncharacterized protein n=1 Tax=Coniochaeta pulveracea TaxID=177199 RepID=A0A420Y4H0_9PEZI|nr:hypothetical protein DL546_002542 [Coniochaeta pulveracea]